MLFHVSIWHFFIVTLQSKKGNFTVQLFFILWYAISLSQRRNRSPIILRNQLFLFQRIPSGYLGAYPTFKERHWSYPATFQGQLHPLFQICTFFLFSIPMMSPWWDSSMFPVTVPYLFPLTNTVMTCSIYMTAAVGVNRYLDIIDFSPR